MNKNRLWFLPVLVCLLACGSKPPQPKSNSGPSPDNSKATAKPSPESSKIRIVFNPDNFESRAVFELVNHQPTLIQQGSRKLVTESAVVTYISGLMPGNIEGLKIEFFTRPLTEADQNDVLDNEGRYMRKTDHASLVLYLDKQNRIDQVNVIYVVPGTTVSRTVTGIPGDLEKYFSDYQFDGDRLRLKSKGTYDEKDANQQTMSLTWDVDIDLPVFDLRKK